MSAPGHRLRPSRHALAALAGLWLSLSACDGPMTGREVETWRFAIEETAGSVQDAYAQRFKQRIEAETNGQVRVVVYPYGALGTSDNILEQVHNGTLDLAMSSPGHLGKLIPEVQVFLLHFTLDADGEVNRCALSDPALKAALDALYHQKGLRFLGAYPEGEMVWTTQRPVRAPRDFEGMKFRVMTSPLLIAAYEAYGANPTPLPYGEVYSGLQLGMIDGQVNPVFAIEEMSFYEVTRWLIFPGLAHFVTTVAGGHEFFERLDDDRRALVQRVLEELHPYVFEAQERFNRERLATIGERKPSLQLLHLTAAERAAFRRAAEPVRARFLEQAGAAGAQLLSTLEAARTRCRGAGQAANR
ncbi:MAG: TRAP transporter substrate-binding protein DctP [Myxococcales bacterium]|nr:TRAP transporter substrate-binding protein DctP [Myxococcales bacterium]